MDALLQQSNFKKTYLEFKPLDKSPKDKDKTYAAYLQSYRDNLQQAIDSGTIPVVTILPGQGFQATTSEFLQNQYGAAVITNIETRLVFMSADATDAIWNAAESDSRQFVIINGLYNTTPDVCRDILDAIDRYKENVQFIISIYDTAVN